MISVEPIHEAEVITMPKQALAKYRNQRAKNILAAAGMGLLNTGYHMAKKPKGALPPELPLPSVGLDTLEDLMGQIQQLSNPIHRGWVRYIQTQVNLFQHREQEIQQHIQSKSKSLFHMGPDIRWSIIDLITAVEQHYVLSTHYYTLERLWRSLPDVFHQRTFLGKKTLQGLSLTSEEQVSDTFTNASQYICSNSTFQGIHLFGNHFAMAVFKECTFANVMFIATQSKDAIEETRSSINAWRENIASLPLPSDQNRNTLTINLQELTEKGYFLRESGRAIRSLDLQSSTFTNSICRYAIWEPDADMANITHEDFTWESVQFRGSAHNWVLLKGVVNATQFKNTIFDGGEWSDLEFTGGSFDHVTIRNARLNDIEFVGTSFRGLYLENCQVNHVTFQQCSFAHELHLDGLCTELHIESPVFQNGLHISGTARWLHIKNAPHMLKEADFSKLRILKLILSHCEPIALNGNEFSVDELIQTDRLVIRNSVREKSQETHQEWLIQNIQGIDVIVAQKDRAPNILRKAQKKESLFIRAIQTEWRDLFLGGLKKNDSIPSLYPLLCSLNLLPITKRSFENAIQSLIVFNEYDSSGFKKACEAVIVKSKSLDETTELLIYQLQDKGYVTIDTTLLKNHIANMRQTIIQANHKQLETNELFLYFAQSYHAPLQEFPNYAWTWLQSNLPQYLPCDEGWLTMFIQSIQELASNPVKFSKQMGEDVPEDKKRLNQIESILELYTEKILTVKADTRLSDMEKTIKIEYWNRLLEKDIQSMEQLEPDSIEKEVPTYDPGSTTENTQAGESNMENICYPQLPSPQQATTHSE